MIQSIQKIIKVGSSAAVTVPAKEMKRLGVKPGDELKVTYEVVEDVPADKVELVGLTQKLIKRHEKALRNLSQR